MGFDEVADALGVGFAMAVAGDGVSAAGGLDADVGPDHAAYAPMEMCTEATLEMAMLSSCFFQTRLPNRRDFTRLTRCELTTSLVGKRRLPLVQRLAVKVSGWGLGGIVDMGLW